MYKWINKDDEKPVLRISDDESYIRFTAKPARVPAIIMGRWSGLPQLVVELDSVSQVKLSRLGGTDTYIMHMRTTGGFVTKASAEVPASVVKQIRLWLDIAAEHLREQEDPEVGVFLGTKEVD